jgi:hypothetical protein
MTLSNCCFAHFLGKGISTLPRTTAAIIQVRMEERQTQPSLLLNAVPHTHLFRRYCRRRFKFLFNSDLQIDISANRDPNSPHHIFFISASNNNDKTTHLLSANTVTMSSNPYDSKIGVTTFCDCFPFHVVCDENLNIIQLGTALAKMILPSVPTTGTQFPTYFDVVRPHVKLNLSAILSRVNSSFIVRMKGLTNHRLSDISL